jgi:predicted ATP-grasp superfamily ATP-dependent carboligase
MTFSKREARQVDEILRFSGHPELKNPSLIVGWTTDAGKMGSRVVDYLVEKLSGEMFCEIDPLEFFPLNGIPVENDLVQLPEGKFYACPENNLLLLRSNPPNTEWHRFLSSVLDLAKQFGVKELHVIGGMITSNAHTSPRRIMATCNSEEARMTFVPYDIINEFDYQTPAGQKPTLNSYLLWEAHKRNIPGVSLWVPIPFYLVNVGDRQGHKIVLEFLNRRFNLGMAIDDLDEAAKLQNVKIAELRNGNPQINAFINKLETNLALTDDETQKLIYDVENCLKSW